MHSSLSKEIISSICKGTHDDPFGILGLHQVEDKKNKYLALRVFRPDAKSVSVHFGNFEKPMNKISEDGFFEYTFPRRKKTFKYKLAVQPHEGKAFIIEDPYAFPALISDFDLQLWGEGNHFNAYKFMGAHPRKVNGVKGTHFVVAAPNAARVSVVGSFNNWDGRIHPMRKHHDQGLWEIFIPQIGENDLYKFEIRTQQEEILLKADPFAFYSELRPKTASIVSDSSSFKWKDAKWMKSRLKKQSNNKPISIYEVHLGSWRRKTGEESEYLNYREIATELVPYVKELEFTHVELMPIAEHPYDPSWGYQQTGYFSPTSRFGTPEDFKYFIEQFHKAGIGVIMDWVPAHFPKDDHGLKEFDGTALFEHADPKKGEHADWGTLIFNYGRTEVKNFLLSNANYWFDQFHIDGLRVDAVASMLYLDYSRKEGDWIPNEYGGNENLDAIFFLRKFNDVVHEQFPGVITFAEESTAWGGVSRPTKTGGLGFDYKWNMGWMNDTLAYFEKDPIHRKYHQDQLTFSLSYAFSEHFTLPLSHDEVVHMKRSLLSKMPGDDWRKFANLRLLFIYMFTHPGKNLLFMGGEFGQWGEWNESVSLDWHLLNWEKHQGVQLLVKDLNTLNKTEHSLHEVDFDWRGFEWIDVSDADNSIISFIRRAKDPEDFLVVVLNFTPTVHHNYKIGVPAEGKYEVILNTDSKYYGGSNAGDNKLTAKGEDWQNQPANIALTVPPLAGIILKRNNN